MVNFLHMVKLKTMTNPVITRGGLNLFKTKQISGHTSSKKFFVIILTLSFVTGLYFLANRKKKKKKSNVHEIVLAPDFERSDDLWNRQNNGLKLTSRPSRINKEMVANNSRTHNSKSNMVQEIVLASDFERSDGLWNIQNNGMKLTSRPSQMSREIVANNSRTHNLESNNLVERIVSGPAFEGLVKPTFSELDEAFPLISWITSKVEIKMIKQVKNSFLEAMYILKKEEYIRCKVVVEDKIFVHVTSKSNVMSIVKDNFDWRRIRRGKYGQGISFSNDFEYANIHANKSIGNKRVFIITKVLVSRTFGGSERLTVPPVGCDTTVGNNKVYVKYHDHEVLPLYVLYYNNHNFGK